MNDWLRIEFPENLADKFESWIATHENNIGVCLVCGDLIRGVEDLIPNTEIHLCEQSILVHYARIPTSR
jgi:hypothetical protein